MHVVKVPAEDIFQALSERIRIRIIRLLADCRSEACLCDLAESLDEPDYKLSRHLKVLRQTGLLDAEKDGRWIYHSLNRGTASLVDLYKFVQTLPDTDKQFAIDRKKFEARKKSSSGARCKTETKNVRSVLKRVRS